MLLEVDLRATSPPRPLRLFAISRALRAFRQHAAAPCVAMPSLRASHKDATINSDSRKR
jgi:hypothetical protein